MELSQDLLSLVCQVLGANMASMRLLGQCSQVCRQWRDIAAAVRAEEGDASFTAKYAASAAAFGAGVHQQMLDAYARALVVDRARRQQFVWGVDPDSDVEHEMHYAIQMRVETAAELLASGLQDRLLHAPAMTECLRELSSLTQAVAEEHAVPVHLTRICTWPVLKILQAHPDDAALGSRALAVLRRLSELETPGIFDYAVIDGAAARLAAHGVVAEFLARFRPAEPPGAEPPGAETPGVRQLTFAERRMLSTGEHVLAWIREGTLIQPDDGEY